METHHLTVAELMTPDPCGVDESLHVEDAVDRMRMNNIRHLVVLRGARLAGVVALDDLNLASAVSGVHAADAPIRIAMRPAFMCSPETPVVEVARAMEARRCDCAVVVDHADTIVGIFTITDALRAVRQLEEGHMVAPEVMPEHNRTPYEVREKRSHSKTTDILREHHGAPNAGQGLAFGRVFPERSSD